MVFSQYMSIDEVIEFCEENDALQALGTIIFPSTPIPATIKEYSESMGIEYLSSGLDENQSNVFIYPIVFLGPNEHYLICRNFKDFKSLILKFKEKKQLPPNYISVDFRSQVIEYDMGGGIATSVPKAFRGVPIDKDNPGLGCLYTPDFDSLDLNISRIFPTLATSYKC